MIVADIELFQRLAKVERGRARPPAAVRLMCHTLYGVEEGIGVLYTRFSTVVVHQGA